MNLSCFSETELVDGLKARVQTERKITAEIIAFIREIDRRRTYLDHGVTSLFAFLTDVIGYSRSAAQRRLEAARLSDEIPQMHEALKSGELNLSHVSLLARALKQKEKEGATPVTATAKHELIEKLKGQSIEQSELIVTQELDLSLKTHDVCRYQKDESIRAEMTFTKSELSEIERAKSLLSHQLRNPELSELFMFLVRDLLKKRDPLKKPVRRPPRAVSPRTTPDSVHTAQQDRDEKINSFRTSTKAHFCKSYGNVYTIKKNKRAYIPSEIIRALHQRDRTCRWIDPRTGNTCGSAYQLQCDHIVPLWAGGTNDADNLQLLCSAHNRLKYEFESEAAAGPTDFAGECAL
ncbi:MAG TPA: HNH endonuclease [Bdellovibrionales bacterium]|nr:HNH endonuclease [Bdellovibrionales bacterium]